MQRRKRPRRTSRALLRQLGREEARVDAIRAALLRKGMELPPPRKAPRSEVRIFMDGAFDMMHYGHVNAFRQGRALGTHLVVGVNSGESITQAKGPPVMGDAERMATIKACKFVDEVVTNVPYVMNDEYVRWMIERYQIDFVVHGDDPCIVDGKDVYASAQALGKYRTIPRTEGVSTTEKRTGLDGIRALLACTVFTRRCPLIEVAVVNTHSDDAILREVAATMRICFSASYHKGDAP